MHQRAVMLLALLLCASTIWAEDPPFRVKAYGVHEGGNVVYHYRVISNPANSPELSKTSQIEVGIVGLRPEDEPQLVVEPVLDVGKPRITAPSGWQGVLSGMEDHPRHTILWETTTIPPEQPAPDPLALMPGQTLSGLSITVPRIDTTYVSSNFFVITNRSQRISGLIEREDTTAPTLTLSVSPTRLRAKAGTLVTVTVTIMAQDDFDPAPEIKLESITANEPLAAGDIAGAAIGTDDRQFQLRDVGVPKGSAGRIYTITYSATDGSGNKATASAVVSVK